MTTLGQKHPAWGNKRSGSIVVLRSFRDNVISDRQAVMGKCGTAGYSLMLPDAVSHAGAEGNDSFNGSGINSPALIHCR